MTEKIKREMGKPLKIGKVYTVPCVRAKWMRRDPWWVPVIGPAHNEAEVIGLPQQHWHVDYRFLPRRERELVFPVLDFATVFGSVITNVVPDPPSLVDQCRLGHDHKNGRVTVDDLPHEGVPPGAYRRVERLRFTAHYPQYPVGSIDWLQDLETAYVGQTLDSGLVCPHKGADLSGIQPVDGVTICPLHGLGWCAETSQLIRTTEPITEPITQPPNPGI